MEIGSQEHGRREEAENRTQAGGEGKLISLSPTLGPCPPCSHDFTWKVVCLSGGHWAEDPRLRLALRTEDSLLRTPEPEPAAAHRRGAEAGGRRVHVSHSPGARRHGVALSAHGWHTGTREPNTALRSEGQAP